VGAASSAGPLTFGAVADAYVQSDKPSTNFGSATTLQADNSPIKHALLKFTVSGIGTNTVSSATLRLYNVDSSSAGGVFYRVPDTSWGETSVTWNTAPAVTGSPLASLGTVSPNIWYEVDLTSLVTGDGTYSIRVTSTSTNGADYTSREGTATSRPQLVVTVQAPAADTVAPVVSITSPATGATVSGGITVQAAASDNVGVTKVDLYIDGVLRGTDAAWPYSFPWDTATASNGSHNLVAVASDAAGNTATSTIVPVNVSNTTPDTTPPSAPGNLSANAPTATRVDLTWNASTDNVGVAHYGIFREGAQIDTASGSSYSDTTASPGTTYGYFVRAYDAAGNFSLPSVTVSVTTPAVPSTSFSFSAAGDHGANSRSDASLAALDASGSSFYLALGDLDYDETPTDEAWCDYIKSKLPTLGPAFPFQLVAGNHEEQGGVDGYILNHAACLPDRLASTIGPNSQYGAEYYFDYPAGGPLLRVIMIPAHLMVENVHYDYAPSTSHYQWLVNAIDGARASGIRWVAVGLHHPCISAGEKLCSSSMANLMNLLIQKKVDLVLQAHDHNYQRSKQLVNNSSTCPTVPINAYDPDCVIDDGADGIYPKGTGTVTVIDGTFGRGLYPINTSDPEAPYFAKLDSTSWGFTKYTVTADRIDARFVNSIGSFTDAFSIVAGHTPGADTTPPTTPTGLTATPLGGTRVDLSWTASTDNVAVDHYSISRGGGLLGTSATTSFSDTSVIPGGTYSYAVTAYDSAGNPSPPSGTVTTTTPAEMTTLTFSPAADAYLLPASPTTNYGSRSTLQVDNSPIAHSLMKFSVSGIGTRAVATAKLRLYNVNESSAGGVFYRVLDSSWGESSVNWNNAPAVAGSAVASLGAVVTNTWYEVNLSSVIRGDGTYSFRITSTSSNGADYTSKEGSASFRPQLVVTLQ
jgi:fibronectin type 3 domain-containing protein